MKLRNLIIALSLFIASNQVLNAQSNVYSVTSGELIFSQSQATFTPEFLAQYSGAELAASNVRFTLFFHLGQYLHVDFNNNIGFFSGLAIRNVGMITDETLPQTVSLTGQQVAYSDYKIVRRQYLLGLPLALKLGSFKDHLYFFGGAEYEWAFVYKEKYWADTWDRSGTKTKSTDWFGSQTPTFLPSVFGGVQFPHGINIKFKYYLTDFLNSNYSVSKNNQDGSTFSISDLTRYETSQVFYFSLCWQFNTSDFKENTKKSEVASR